MSAKRFSSLIAAEGRLSEAVSEEKRLPFEGYVSLEKIQIRVTIVAIAAKKWCCKSKDLTNLRMVQKNAQSLVFKWVIGSVKILSNHLLVQWNLFPGANVHLFSFLDWSLDFNNSHTNRAWCLLSICFGQCIRGDPGAASRDDKMFVAKVYYKIDLIINFSSPGSAIRICLPSIISEVASNKNELWKLVRLTRFQKPQLSSVPVFFKTAHPFFLLYLLCYLYLRFVFWAVFLCFTQFGGDSNCLKFDW